MVILCQGAVGSGPGHLSPRAGLSTGGDVCTGLQAFALALPSKESFEDTDGPQGAADSRWPLLEFRQREGRQPGK